MCKVRADFTLMNYTTYPSFQSLLRTDFHAMIQMNGIKWQPGNKKNTNKDQNKAQS